MGIEDWRKGLARRRLRAGDGSPLRPFRWWQLLSRSVFSLPLAAADGRDAVTYTVDVKLWGDRDDGEVRARLYTDGAQTAMSKVPARFPVAGGTIEVAVNTFGLRRCHYVADDGTETQLTPDPRSGEGRRARLAREQPALSRAIAAVSIVIVLGGVALALLQLAEPISRIPPIADTLGTFVSPIVLPWWGNLILALVVATASIERALRMRSSWIDQLAS